VNEQNAASAAYRHTGSYSNNNKSHNKLADSQNASSPADECDHGEAKNDNPQHGAQEAQNISASTRKDNPSYRCKHANRGMKLPSTLFITECRIDLD